jgi:predicted RNA binding protein YcfA (HicA-like mRNA interferase family)
MTDYQRWINRVIKFCESLGWTVHQNGHIKFKSPDGKMVSCSLSPRTSSAIHAVRRDFKRAGLVLDL